MSSNSGEGSHCVLGDGFKAVLLDVAGTTTAINFVKETLLPFASNNAEDFLKSNWDDETVKEAVKALNGEKELTLEEATKLFKDLTEASSDNVGVKTLQGLIYKKGYTAGDIKAHVFSDVATAFETWSKTHKIAIYSTGSIESQKLLFANTTSGDLTSHINNYYDQKIGSKTETEAYKKITDDLGLKPEEIVFITDSPAEAKAAQTAKLEAVLVERDGNEKLDDEAKKQFKIITSFNEISFEATGKRKSEEEPAVTEDRPAKVAKTAEETPETMEVDGAAEKIEEKTVVVVEEPVEAKEKTIETETVKTDDIEITEIEETDAKTEEADQPQPIVTESETVEKIETAPVKEETEKKTEESEKEKENKSELANGGNTDTEQNGDMNGKTEDDAKTEDTGIKVKKIEETEETAPVSVEA